jgi:CheY-like chemotaxis protein
MQMFSTPALTSDSAEPRVLVVEDDDAAFDLISRCLRSAQLQPVRARTGHEAVRLAGDLRPSVITLDLGIPGMDGWEVLKALKADPALATIPVVIVSMNDNRELGMALGADDYFLKPIDKLRFVERMEQLTGNDVQPARVLIIDDDPDVHSMLGESLPLHGFQIVSAYDGAEGLLLASRERPDVVLLDLLMPGLSGFEVADALRSHPVTASIPIVILTSRDVSAADMRALGSSLLGVVQKGSVTPVRLVEEIRLLQRRAAQTAAVPQA